MKEKNRQKILNLKQGSLYQEFKLMNHDHFLAQMAKHMGQKSSCLNVL